MGLFPELGRFGGRYEIKEIPDQPEIPPKLTQETGIKAVERAIGANVKDGRADVIQSPETRQFTLQIPDVREKMEKLSKQSVGDSSTWFGAYFVRMIKKALYFGWKIVVGRSK